MEGLRDQAAHDVGGVLQREEQRDVLKERAKTISRQRRSGRRRWKVAGGGRTMEDKALEPA